MPEDVFGIVGTVQAGTFKVREVVAEGGFAVVYRARHKAFRSNVALKCLKIPASLNSEEQKGFLRAFREEAELLFRLSAAIPAVVRPLQVGKLSGQSAGFTPFLALEWLKGRTLSEFLDARTEAGIAPPRMSQTMRLLAPVAEALDRAHNFPGPKGPVVVVHRDLKPDNIFVAEVGGTRTVKILDFGIAKAKSVAHQLVGEQSMRASDFAAFTPAYAAPEQWHPKKYGQTGAWTDVWGLAMVMVECVVGQPIDRGEPAEFMARSLNPHERPTPRTMGAKVRDPVEEVFQRALAVDPKDRYQQIGLFWVDLVEAIGKSAEKLPPVAFTSAQSSTADGTGGITATADSDNVLQELAMGSYDQEVPSLRLNFPSQVAGVSVEEEDDDEDSSAPSHALVDEASDSVFGTVSTDLSENEIGGFTLMNPGQTLELDAPVRVPKPRPRPVRPIGPGMVHHEQEPELTFSDLRAQLGLNGPIAMTAIGTGLMVVDWGYRLFIGESIRLGPMRMLWIAGPIVVVGLALLIARVARADG